MELFQPQLLSKDEIIKILKERQLKEPNLEKLSKDELVILFKKYAMPLHRRDNRRGKTDETGSDESVNLVNNKNNEVKLCCIKPQIDNSADNSTSNQHKRIKFCSTSNVLNSVTNGFSRKRLNDNEINDNDSSITKRKKITYP